MANAKETPMLNLDRLTPYLATRLPGAGEGLEVTQIKGGSSNPTFILTTKGGARYILRKKPAGPLLPSAHQIEREHRIMHALRDSDVPVPRMQLLCEDDSIVGTPFYVMDFVEGRVFRDATLPDQTPLQRTQIYAETNRVLAALHKVDHQAVGLGDFGRPGNYFERQVKRWTTQYRAAETSRIEAMERLIDYLPANIPADDSVSIAHGDYRPENMIFHPTEPRILAVLDWELSTIGHPLADLAYNCVLYHSDSPTFGTLKAVDFATSGIPTEAQYVAAYCERTGRASIDNWNFYLAFSLFRLAAIGQGVFRRAQQGQSDASRGGADNSGVVTRAETAWHIAHS